MICAISCLSLLACSNNEDKPDPSDQVIKDVVSFSESAELSICKTGSNENLLDYARVDSYNALMDKFKDYQLEVVDSDNSKGSYAFIELKIKTYPFGIAYVEATDELNAMAQLGAIDVDDNETIANYYAMKMSSLSSRDYSRVVTITCTYTDSKWETDVYENEEFQDAICGGMNSAGNEQE